MDPQRTATEMTLAVLVLYAWRRGLIAEPTPGTKEWEAWNTLLRGPRPRNSVDDAELYQLLRILRARYVLPEDWRGLRRYIGYVIKALRRHPRAKQRDADALGISRATLYRWRKTATDQEVAARAKTKQLRLEAMRLLRDSFGKSPEAARKMIQRRLSQGWSPESLVQRLRREAMRVGGDD